MAFLSPGLALLALFQLFPTAQAIYLAFTRWDGFAPPKLVGLRNFSNLLSDQDFLTALSHNLLLLLIIPGTVVLSLVVALALMERPFGWRFFRASFFMPAVLSPVIIGSFFNVMLDQHGPVNGFFDALGLHALSHPWLADSSTALWTLMAVNVWGQFGTGVLLYLAALAHIDIGLYEAAKLDGAGWWQAHRHITLPLIRPVTQFWVMLVTISVFTAQFALVLTLTNGGPGNATMVLEFYIYREAFSSGALGYASAVGIVLFLLVLVTLAVQRLGLRTRWAEQ